MTFIDLFAGVGGFRRGMEREGIEIVEMQDCGDYYEPIVG